MDIKLIKEVLALMDQSGLTTFRYKSKMDGAETIEIELEKKVADPVVYAAPPAGPTMQTTMPLPAAMPATAPAEPAPATAPVEEEQPFADAKSLTAPMVGVFHEAKKGGSSIKTGTKLSKGDVVCVIEAMKLMNDILMPEDGVVEHIAVSQGGFVEFDQLLIYYK